MSFLFNKKTVFIFSALVAVFFFSKIVLAVWDGFPYDQGETLNPECLPTDVDCDVNVVPTTITVADTTDATSFVGLFESATGNLGPKTDAGLTYNATTGVLTATGLSGPLTGNVTGNVSGSSGSTTGNAATATALQNARTIYGNSFDGTANLAQVIASTYGGTGNGFTKFTGPTTAEKTFTLPDASATLLYSGGDAGTPSALVGTNISGTAAGLSIGGTAATVTGATQAAITSAANLATIGTIGTGVWQGTTIKANYLQQAAADLGDADITVDFTNSNAGNVTNLTIDGTFQALSVGLTGTRIANGFFTDLAVTN